VGFGVVGNEGFNGQLLQFVVLRGEGLHGDLLEVVQPFVFECLVSQNLLNVLHGELVGEVEPRERQSAVVEEFHLLEIRGGILDNPKEGGFTNV
jgi:hypothetical protein